MKKKYTRLNTIGAVLGVFFAIGIIWQWRPLYSKFTNKPPEKTEQNVVSYKDFVKEDSEKDGSGALENAPKDDKDNEAQATSTQKTPTSTTKTEKEVAKEETEEKKNEETSKEENSAPDTAPTTAYNELQGLHEGVVINLDVPYTSQAPEKKWEQPWQDACEEVSILMLDAYYKGYGLSPLFVKDEVYKMVAWEEQQGWGRSIHIEKLKQLHEHFFTGKKPRIIENPTVEQIKNFIKKGTPVLAVAHGKSLPNQWYSNGGPEYHALIIRGYTDSEFITNDPGVNRGRNFAFSYESMMNAIHDWNDGDVVNGPARVMVLE